MRHDHNGPPSSWAETSREGRWQRLKAEARQHPSHVLQPEATMAHPHLCGGCAACAAAFVLLERETHAPARHKE